MIVVGELLWALVCIHLFWFYCYLTGTIARAESRAEGSKQPSRDYHYVIDLVITSVTGLSITGFVLLLLGLIGLLNVWALLVWLVVEAILFKLVRHENVFRTDFWTSRLRNITRAWSLASIIIYVVFLVIAVPAILPPTLWDSISYHLAYAVSWANAGHIYADEFLRFPYYANNFLLIYALMFALKVGQVTHFATWLCGLLSSLGIYGLVTYDQPLQAKGDRWASRFHLLKSIILPLTPALSLVFIRYVDVGYIDVPIGLFLLAPVLCTYSVLMGSRRNYEVDLVLSSAFCVGMKISLFLDLPLFILSLVLVMRRQRKTLTQVALLTGLLIVLSGPWYVRNLISVGDPIPPTLNLMFRGHDRIFSRQDYADLLSAVQTPRTASAMLAAPIKLFSEPEIVTVGEFGTNLSVVFLYLPLAMLPFLLFRRFRKRLGTGFVYINVALVYLILNWIGISALGRYFLHLFPIYMVYLGLCFNGAVRAVEAVTRKPLKWISQTALFLILFALPIPSPTSLVHYAWHLQRNYLDLPEQLENKRLLLRTALPGYTSAQAVMDKMYANGGPRGRVLTIRFENISYYFRARNTVSMGDWFGPGRYSDLMDSIDRLELDAYLKRFDIAAVMINSSSNPMTEQQYESLVKQLEQNHFTLQPNLESNTIVYLKSG